MTTRPQRPTTVTNFPSSEGRTLICFPDDADDPNEVYITGINAGGPGKVVREHDDCIVVRWGAYRIAVWPYGYVHYPKRETRYRVTGNTWHRRIGDGARSRYDLALVVDPQARVGGVFGQGATEGDCA